MPYGPAFDTGASLFRDWPDLLDAYYDFKKKYVCFKIFCPVSYISFTNPVKIEVNLHYV
jgi:hypothetical protein